MKPLSALKPLFLAALLVTFVISENRAATLYSTGAANWRWTTGASWTYNSNGSGNCSCTPGSGDVIYIRATDSISVPSTVNVSGNVTLHVYGELNITGFLDLLGSGSVVNIYSGGMLTSNGSASSKLRIGGTATAEYSGNDGDLSGPWTISNGSSGPMALPVVLTSFEGSYTNNSITLTWLTAEETNNDRFEIQKSTDGKTFTTIGEVNANHAQSYNFTDETIETSVNYYRLFQIDLNGSGTYSSIIKITASDDFDFTVYPNPAAGNEFTIQFAASGSVTIHNTNGTLLYSAAVAEKSYLSGQEIPVLEPGMYFVTVSDGKNLVNKKVVVK